jgi:hypothetical protein
LLFFERNCQFRVERGRFARLDLYLFLFEYVEARSGDVKFVSAGLNSPEPDEVEVALVVTPREFLIVTLAPTIRLPIGSVTVPLRLPVFCWAGRAEAKAKMSSKQRSIRGGSSHVSEPRR